MIQIFNRWYHGKPVTQHFDNLNADSTGCYVFPSVYTEYHWTAQAARHLTDFYLSNWKFIVGVAIAVAVFFLTSLKSQT
jgi:hypothetical protein